MKKWLEREGTLDYEHGMMTEVEKARAGTGEKEVRIPPEHGNKDGTWEVENKVKKINWASRPGKMLQIRMVQAGGEERLCSGSILEVGVGNAEKVLDTRALLVESRFGS